MEGCDSCSLNEWEYIFGIVDSLTTADMCEGFVGGTVKMDVGVNQVELSCPSGKDAGWVHERFVRIHS